MLDLARLQRIHLRRRPPGQLVVAALLGLDYRFPRRTEIIVEGLERIPQDRSVMLAMNHTDRYNYWPFQYTMHTHRLRYTATWVKGKYYQNPLMAWFLDKTGNIPLPSRGYVVSVAFQQAMGRPPDASEYRLLRDLLDGTADADAIAPDSAVGRWLAECGGVTAWVEERRRAFTAMMNEVMRITREAMLDHDLHVLVFPEGTRRKRLGRGHTGLIQVAWHLDAAIVPIGCNGSDRVYPTNSPFARGGRIVYRVGEVLEPDGPELGPHRVSEDYTPFTSEATKRHGQAFRAGTDVVMAHIARLLDPEYQPAEDDDPGRGGADRFL
ncbi:MAG: 1-acyl-sn-glycerol-3-phosphate acyltransferase [Deltaproteobacteria bacterium]|nr:MAG: 1-acyl-sn-glycerol-3-phosphate acyltransferase [Deltaproteobacteria bacterium]